MAVVDAPPVSEIKFIPLAEAAARLGISRNSVLRRLKAGRLSGYPDPNNGYYYVSEPSVEATLYRLNALRAAATLPGGEPLDDRWTDQEETSE